MKFASDREYADPEKAAQAAGNRQYRRGHPRRSHSCREDQWPVSIQGGGTPAEYKAGLELAISRGWLWKHESGTYVKFAQIGADLFA
jgi:hypothetical protein